MSIINRMRKQKAVWWEAMGSNQFGVPGFAQPVEVDCRWEDTIEEFLDAEGNRQLSRSIVYVDRVMRVTDRLFLGTIEDLDSGVTTPPENAFAIRKFDRLPNLRNTQTLLTAYL